MANETQAAREGKEVTRLLEADHPGMAVVTQRGLRHPDGDTRWAPIGIDTLDYRDSWALLDARNQLARVELVERADPPTGISITVKTLNERWHARMRSSGVPTAALEGLEFTELRREVLVTVGETQTGEELQPIVTTITVTLMEYVASGKRHALSTALAFEVTVADPKQVAKAAELVLARVGDYEKVVGNYGGE